MAKEILDAIYNAEEECKTREAEAEKAADEKIEVAKKQAEELIKNAEAEAERNSTVRIESIKSEAEAIYNKAQNAADSKSSLISSIAEKNRADVIKQSVEALLQ